jgi:hypothetical protein
MTSRPTAYYIDRDQMGGPGAGDRQSGIVGNPKITAKPDDRRFHSLDLSRKQPEELSLTPDLQSNPAA